jgi:hypothetical protein
MVEGLQPGDPQWAGPYRLLGRLGLAIGHAMGAPTEFSDMTRIAADYGPWRAMPLPLSSGRALVTDDIQMTRRRWSGGLGTRPATPTPSPPLAGPLLVRTTAPTPSPRNGCGTSNTATACWPSAPHGTGDR